MHLCHSHSSVMLVESGGDRILLSSTVVAGSKSTPLICKTDCSFDHLGSLCDRSFIVRFFQKTGFSPLVFFMSIGHHDYQSGLCRHHTDQRTLPNAHFP